ncbi:MAG: aspartate 1-decarboxylase [Bacteroidetes bacterium]|jgi:aspartate 1-decarboxylase|nr:aspartate 1-decarboxylase [Bacteroidota bacterium]MBX7130755.1 aspartate 1-decarboxylase [Flavobacteriales bacterium]MCC6655012.1 aspartate 1-decarboxylase [Flavobacteriales bacterium]HMU13755.1 aspartate 1-decarboxylase [Flavobacteriales bacterium]HMW97658.1 aspartate 1-decarboxylase [Flavobacteriales bacterium]
MTIEVLRTKIHRITVTEANVDYIGSITLDEDLIDASGLVEGEKVTVLDITNGERLDTYVIKGERGSGMVCMNGPAALRVKVGDVVIVLSYARMSVEEARVFRPTIVFPNERTNRLKG